MANDITFSIGANAENFNATLVQVRQSVVQVQQSIAQTANGMRRFEQLAGIASNVTTTLRNCVMAARHFVSAWAQAARFEDVSVRLAPLVGGLEQAESLAKNLREQAANGTRSFEQLAGVAGKLASVFKDTAEIEAWTKRFHDLSAGTGTDMDAVAENFVKAKASGYFKAGFLDMFAREGVNIYAPLAKEMNMSEFALRKLAQTGKLAFSDVEQAIISVTAKGGQFNGMAEKMSATANGTWSTLVARFQILLAEFAKPVNAAIVPVLNDLIAKAKELQPAVAELGEMLAGFTRGFAAFVTGIGGAPLAIAAITLALPKLIAGIRAAIAAVAALRAAVLTLEASTVIPLIVGAVATVATWAWTRYASSADEAAESNRKLAQSLEEIRDAYAQIKSTAALNALHEDNKANFDRRREKVLQEAGYADFETFRRGAAIAEQEIKIADAAPWFSRWAVRGDDYDENKRIAGLYREYSNIDQEEAEANAAYELRAAEVARAEVAKKSERAKLALADASKKAAESYRKLNAEIAVHADKRELDAADVAARPQKLLDQAGYADASALDFELSDKKMMLEWDVAGGKATAEQVEEYKKLVELRERYEELSQAAQKEEAAAQKRLDAANAAYSSRRTLLEAELAGNKELVEQLRRQNRERELAAEYEAEGVGHAEAARRAKEMAALEDAQEKMNAAARSEERAAGSASRIGSGIIGTAQASVGGGHSVSIGMSSSMSTAREQLSVSRSMLAALNKISENTGAEKNTSAAVIA